MKIVIGKHSKRSTFPLGSAQPAVAFDLSLGKIPKFNGFSYSVQEGIGLSKRSFTEIPGLRFKLK